MDAQIMTALMSIIGGGGLVAIIQVIAAKHKTKFEAADVHVKTAMELERVAMDRYSEASQSLDGAQKLLSEAKKELAEAKFELAEAKRELLEAKETKLELAEAKRDLAEAKRAYDICRDYAQTLVVLLEQHGLKAPEMPEMPKI